MQPLHIDSASHEQAYMTIAEDRGEATDMPTFHQHGCEDFSLDTKPAARPFCMREVVVQNRNYRCIKQENPIWHCPRSWVSPTKLSVSHFVPPPQTTIYNVCARLKEIATLQPSQM